MRHAHRFPAISRIIDLAARDAEVSEVTPQITAAALAEVADLFGDIDLALQSIATSLAVLSNKP